MTEKLEAGMLRRNRYLIGQVLGTIIAILAVWTWMLPIPPELNSPLSAVLGFIGGAMFVHYVHEEALCR